MITIDATDRWAAAGGRGITAKGASALGRKRPLIRETKALLASPKRPGARAGQPLL